MIAAFGGEFARSGEAPPELHRFLIVASRSGKGLRKTRYRGLAKPRLASYFIAAACKVRRWAHQIAWQGWPRQWAVFGEKTEN